MTLLAATPLRRSVAIGGVLLVLASRLPAQVALSHAVDAAPVPAGMLRLQVTNAWTRFDQRYGPSGLLPLGEELSADPLGAAQLPLLAPAEATLRTLTGNPRTRLSLGKLVTRGDARIVTTPISLEYGLTRWLSVGVVVPVVQTRRTVGVTVNAASGPPATVGFVAPAQRNAAVAANTAASQSAAAAASRLSTLIAQCAANAAASGCAAINGDPAGAAAAVVRAQQLAAAAQALGTTAATALVAPREAGTIALEIELQRNALNADLQRFLGDPGVSASRIYFTPTPFAYMDLQGGAGTPGLLQSAVGGGLDSIRTTERIGIGDVSIGAQLLLYDGFQRDTLPLRRVQARLAVGGAVRLATSRADTATNLVDIGTGDGAGVQVHGAFDVIVGRVGGTVAGRYARSFARTVSAPLLGDPEAGFPLPSFGARERTAGDVLGLDVTPRYLLTEDFALDAHYGLERVAGATWGAVTQDTALPAFCAFVTCDTPAPVTRTAQRAGLGLRYSTVNSYLRGRASQPFEVSFTHLTTVSGDPGVPKLSREQIQVRFFYQLFGRR